MVEISVVVPVFHNEESLPDLTLRWTPDGGNEGKEVKGGEEGEEGEEGN